MINQLVNKTHVAKNYGTITMQTKQRNVVAEIKCHCEGQLFLGCLSRQGSIQIRLRALLTSLKAHNSTATHS